MHGEQIDSGSSRPGTRVENGATIARAIMGHGPPAACLPPVGDQSMFASRDFIPPTRGQHHAAN
jgi:hypothetical protein